VTHRVDIHLGYREGHHHNNFASSEVCYGQKFIRLDAAMMSSLAASYHARVSIRRTVGHHCGQTAVTLISLPQAQRVPRRQLIEEDRKTKSRPPEARNSGYEAGSPHISKRTLTQQRHCMVSVLHPESSNGNGSNATSLATGKHLLKLEFSGFERQRSRRSGSQESAPVHSAQDVIIGEQGCVESELQPSPR
jgi:hypothetical protein